MNKHYRSLFILITLMFLLVACNGSFTEIVKEIDTKSVKVQKETTEIETVQTANNTSDAIFDLSVTNKGTPIEGGILQVAMVKDEPFAGIFLPELYEDSFDGDIMSFASNSIFDVDGDFLITDEGIASMEVDQKNNKVTVKIREGIKWSDGEPLKIEDLILPYKIIAHKDYSGKRYDSSIKNIVGIEDYHDGVSDTISGIKKIDSRTMEISFHQLSPAIFSGGDGLWTNAAPSHHIGHIPVSELIESDEVRKNPVTLGAFKFEKIVPGESVQFIKNEHYWKGEPKIDGVVVQVVPSSSISVAIGSGEYDIVMGFNATKMPEIEKFHNITVLGRPELYYSYLGFKVGKFDNQNNIVVTDLEGSKMGNKNLRQAMGYALDIEAVSEVYYDNLRERANSLIPPVFASFHDESIEGYYYDPEKAKTLLDEGGYIDIDGDGLREDPNGQKLEIKLAAIAGDVAQEEIITYYLQNWKDVGLNVTLSSGRLFEFNSFYDKIETDDPEIDLFMGAWGTGTNPSPAGLYGQSDPYNLTRFTSEFLETTIKNIDSPKSFDAEYRASQFRAFQEYMAEMAPVIPMQFRYEIVPVNKRVKNYSIEYGNGTELHEIQLVSDEPFKN
nr:oligopeptide ABC transporter substrate-binding protein [Lysinibacillus timonensis]